MWDDLTYKEVFSSHTMIDLSPTPPQFMQAISGNDSKFASQSQSP